MGVFPVVLRVETADVSKLTFLIKLPSASSMNMGYDVLQLLDPIGLLRPTGHVMQLVAPAFENFPLGHMEHTAPFINVPAEHATVTQLTARPTDENNIAQNTPCITANHRMGCLYIFASTAQGEKSSIKCIYVFSRWSIRGLLLASSLSGPSRDDVLVRPPFVMVEHAMG
jgi:hypothetical protein